MKDRISLRIKMLQERLQQENIDAAMIYDRENLIYFAGIDDIEGGALAIPAVGEPTLFCLWMESDYIKKKCGIENVVPYVFPEKNQSVMMGEWLKQQGYKKSRLGFTRYFISVKDFLCLEEADPEFKVVDIATICYEIRSVKDSDEIEKIKFASKALCSGMDAAVKEAKAGMRETDLLAEAEYAMAKAGSMGSTFRMQVLTKSRQLQLHPYASNAIIENNGPLVVHLGASFGGYASKMCRTIFLGKPEKESLEIYKTLIEAQTVAVDFIKPGVTCGEVYDVVDKFVSQKGYEKYWVMKHIGYGVGIRQSEFYPIISKGSDVVLKENMVIDLLLPTIYMRNYGGPRITDTILIEDKGAKYLTDYSREVIFK